MAEAMCQRLRMSNDDTEQISAIIAQHMKFPELPKMRESTLKRFLPASGSVSGQSISMSVSRACSRPAPG